MRCVHGLLLLVLLATPLAADEPVKLLLPAAEASRRPFLAFQVGMIFAERCNHCHGAHLAKPRGRFGFILDLDRVAADPRFVIRHQPKASRLWEVLHEEEMPPADSGTPPLTPEQKEVVHQWIAAGAPSPATALAETPAGQDDAAGSVPLLNRLVTMLGKAHVVVVHFPLGLLLAAAFAEGLLLWRKERVPSPTVRYCVLVGSAGAFAAAVLGWTAASQGAGSSSLQILTLHRWMGTATCVWAVLAAVLSEADVRSGIRTWRFRSVLFVGALMVGLTGHLGGLLVHGENYFEF